MEYEDKVNAMEAAVVWCYTDVPKPDDTRDSAFVRAFRVRDIGFRDIGNGKVKKQRTSTGTLVDGRPLNGLMSAHENRSGCHRNMAACHRRVRLHVEPVFPHAGSVAGVRSPNSGSAP